MLIEEALSEEVIGAAIEVHRVHRAQILTDMRLLSSPVGLILSFDAPLRNEGVHRLVL